MRRFGVYLANQLATALCFWFTNSGNITIHFDHRRVFPITLASE